jgi:hypothetical protein
MTVAASAAPVTFSRVLSMDRDSEQLETRDPFQRVEIVVRSGVERQGASQHEEDAGNKLVQDESTQAPGHQGAQHSDHIEELGQASPEPEQSESQWPAQGGLQRYALQQTHEQDLMKSTILASASAKVSTSVKLET